MRVRLTTFARSDKDLLRHFSSRYLKGSNSWNDLEFVTDNSYDKLVILTYPHQLTLEAGYNKYKAITFLTEPSISTMVKTHPTSHILDVHLHLPFLPRDYNSQRTLATDASIRNKSRLLSAVVSELYVLPGHQLRLEFIYILDQYIKEGLDIYGRPSHNRFFSLLANYKGALSEKYDGLWAYAYHIACENVFENGYFTEKLIDPIMTETLCFYDGCPNISSFIDERAYIKLDISNIESSLHLIIKSIRDQEYKKRLKFIRQEKKRFMTDLHPFNMIWMAVHGKDVCSIYQT